METQQDFRELLGLLNKHGVEYLIAGAHALAYHGVPRYTGDIDIYVRPSTKNSRSIMQALNEFGFGSAGLSETDFTAEGKVIQLGVPPVRVDIITSLTSLAWEEASSGSCQGSYGDVPVRYLGRVQLIKNKLALGRKKDLADVEALDEDK